MPKIRIAVNKLENATAEYISMVTRGANRIPFKIVKAHPKERNMINLGQPRLDLSDLGNVLKHDDKQHGDPPAKLAAGKVVGIVVEKGEHLTPEVLAELKGAGVNTEQSVENEDGTITYGEAVDPDTVTVAKMSENALALLTGVDPVAVVKDTPFAPLYEDMGFLPSLAEANDITREAVQKSEDATQLAQATAGNASYQQRLVEVVPAVAFKADSIICKACAGRKKKQDTQAALDGSAKKADGPACPEGMDQAEWDKMPSEDKQKHMDEKQQEATQKAEQATARKVEIEAVVNPLIEPVQKALAEITASLTEIKKGLGDIGKVQGEHAATITTMQAAVAKAEGVLKTTLIGAAPNDDHKPANTTRKAEVGTLGIIDTAFDTNVRRVRKQARAQ